ncbi:MAG: hypothetical protein AB1Y26_00525 [Cycloclasticus sp.]
MQHFPNHQNQNQQKKIAPKKQPNIQWVLTLYKVPLLLAAWLKELMAVRRTNKKLDLQSLTLALQTLKTKKTKNHKEAQAMLSLESLSIFFYTSNPSPDQITTRKPHTYQSKGVVTHNIF